MGSQVPVFSEFTFELNSGVIHTIEMLSIFKERLYNLQCWEIINVYVVLNKLIPYEFLLKTYNGDFIIKF